jgi:cyclopropane fatty-acyl-phospholipid synthase-like methyltransferase
MTAFWDGQAERFDRDARSHGEVYDKTIARAAALLSPSDTVLDFGCATGEYSVGIAGHVASVHGIDLSPKMIGFAEKNARERGLENVQFSRTDLLDASLSAGSFSAVLAFNIFHLLPDAQKALTRVHDLLTSGGLLLSQTPCLGERPLLYNLLLRPASVLGFMPKILKLRIADFEELVSHSGFDIVESMGWEDDAPVQWIVARKR